MDILEFAMQMELDGKAFYEKLAQKTTNMELSKVLVMLSEEEEKHYYIFKKLKDGDSPETLIGSNNHTKVLESVKNIFVELSNNAKDASFTENEQSIWAEALKIEQKSEQFYREKALEETDAQKKNLLNLIANEERNHIYLIDSILTYMKFPDTFADTAQFKNFQSLEGH